METDILPHSLRCLKDEYSGEPYTLFRPTTLETSFHCAPVTITSTGKLQTLYIQGNQSD
jgi:hypothetical protein